MTRAAPYPVPGSPDKIPFTKIAITVPTEIYAVVERLRRRLGKTRSSVVAQALEAWVRSADLAEADRRYVEGYRRTPEAVDEISAVAAQATSHWQTWAPGEPSRAADSRPGKARRRARTSPAPRPRARKRSGR
jgi:predicted DNA-binding protein